jgi:hypothetical protein
MKQWGVGVEGEEVRVYADVNNQVMQVYIVTKFSNKNRNTKY